MAEATDWFARQRSADMQGTDRRALDRWLATPAHAAAFAEVESLWHAVEGLHDDPHLLAFREEARRNGRVRHFRRLGAIAASFLILILGMGLFYQYAFVPDPVPAQSLRFATTTGQRLPIALADGSTIQLDADSAVRVAIDDNHRAIEIEKGRAYFQVSHDPRRPFVVSAGGRSVTAVGTAFSVDTLGNGLDVVLVEGRVRVRGRSNEGRHAVEMTAGSRLLASADGRWRAGQIDTGKATAWLHGQLVFDNARLSDVVAEINRYTDRTIALADDGTGEKRLSAVLNAGDVNSFVQAVAMLNLARARTEPDGSLVLRQK
ncbi:FecR family protein [Sphingobium estronivorans]|uniref:FecR family protein n=1 Tax=Sphingobium estronivorans TaxID=1577690 RepID=UPI0013C36DA2|nr:FecR domain-containing protein [Sphingobium estronivorans]